MAISAPLDCWTSFTNFSDPPADGVVSLQQARAELRISAQSVNLHFFPTRITRNIVSIIDFPLLVSQSYVPASTLWVHVQRLEGSAVCAMLLNPPQNSGNSELLSSLLQGLMSPCFLTYGPSLANNLGRKFKSVRS